MLLQRVVIEVIRALAHVESNNDRSIESVLAVELEVKGVVVP